MKFLLRKYSCKADHLFYGSDTNKPFPIMIPSKGIFNEAYLFPFTIALAVYGIYIPIDY